MADSTIEANQKAGTLNDLRHRPYRATVEFEEVHPAPAMRTEGRRAAHVAHVVFASKHHASARIPSNPLGLAITHFRDDMPFVTEANPSKTPRSN